MISLRCSFGYSELLGVHLKLTAVTYENPSFWGSTVFAVRINQSHKLFSEKFLTVLPYQALLGEIPHCLAISKYDSDTVEFVQYSDLVCGVPTASHFTLTRVDISFCQSNLWKTLLYFCESLLVCFSFAAPNHL